MEIRPVSNMIAISKELNQSGPSEAFSKLEDHIAKGSPMEDVSKGVIVDVIV